LIIHDGLRIATEKKTTIFAGTWQVEPRDGDYPAGGRAAAREKGTADREGRAMGSRNQRTARRFQVEALETRWTPGGASGGMLVYGAACHNGEEIPQVHVVLLGGRTGSGGEVAPTPCGGAGGLGGDF
jgi:hypothetical protein